MAKANKTLYTALAVLGIVLVWALMFYWPTPELDAALKSLNQAGPEQRTDLEGVRMTLHIREGTATVSISNEGKESAYLPDEARGRAYSLQVSNAAGLRLNKPLSPMPVEDAVMVPLLPGTVYQRRFDLGLVLRLPAGLYTVQATYAPVAVNRKYEGSILRSNSAEYVVSKGEEDGR